MNLSSTWAQGMEREQICLLQTLKKKLSGTQNYFFHPSFFYLSVKNSLVFVIGTIKGFQPQLLVFRTE